MLIYCSQLVIRGTGATNPILEAVAAWLNRKTSAGVTPESLVDGLALPCGDNQVIQCATATGPSIAHFAIQLRHPDQAVSGRDWITDIGGQQEEDAWRFSVTLSTHETSRYVPPPEQTTRPQVVREIIDRCTIDSATVGITARPLTLTDAEAFDYRIRDSERAVPIVVVSCDRTGVFFANPNRLAALLTGIAEVVFIPRDVDTFHLEHLLGSAHSAYGGAVTIIWQRDRPGSPHIPTSKLIPEVLLEVRSANSDIESELLAKICHRCNAANFRRAITLESVRRLAAQLRLKLALTQGETSKEFIALVQDVDREQRNQIDSLTRDLETVLDDLARSDAERERLEQLCEALKQSYSAALVHERNVGNPNTGIAPRQLLDLVLEELTLERCLDVVELVYPNRVVILDSARRSAAESSEFANSRRALELMDTLCDAYWNAVRQGSDQEAKAVFGNAFAANESESARNNPRAKDLRTFVYKGERVEMMKHLKIGTKESTAETWRLHFHWDAADAKIVIGHCGKHLDHR